MNYEAETEETTYEFVSYLLDCVWENKRYVRFIRQIISGKHRQI